MIGKYIIQGCNRSVDTVMDSTQDRSRRLAKTNRRQFLLFTAASGSIGCGVGTTSVIADETSDQVGTIEGTVTFEDEDQLEYKGDQAGNYDPTATVEVDGPVTSETRTEDGTYTLEVEPGEYSITISSGMYEEDSETVVVGSGETVTHDVTLELNQGTFLAIVEDADGAVGDVTGEIGDQTDVTSSDFLGNILGFELNPDVYTFSLSHEEYAPFAETVTIERGKVLVREIELLEQTGTGTIEGAVVNHFGNPIEGAEVGRTDVPDQSISTDEAGEYSLELPVGKHVVDIFHDGYGEKSIDVNIEAGETFRQWTELNYEYGSDEGTLRVEIDAAYDEIFEVRATLVGDGSSEEEFEVFGNISSQEFTLPSGPWQMTVSRPLHYDMTETVFVEPNETTTLQFDQFEKLQEGIIEGHVESNDGLPVDGAVIEIDIDAGGTVSTTTDPDGYYSIELFEGTHSMNISHNTHEPTSTSVEVLPNENVTEDVSLVSYGEVEGVINDRFGTPLPARYRELDSLDDANVDNRMYIQDAIDDVSITVGEERADIADDGTFRVAVEQGEYTLDIEAPGFEKASTNVTVFSGKTKSVGPFELEREWGEAWSGRCEVWVRPESDGTLVPFDVRAYGAEPTDWVTIESGSIPGDEYSYYDLHPGFWEIVVEPHSPGLDKASKEVLIPEEGKPELYFYLEEIDYEVNGRIEGTVSNENGDPIGGSEVRIRGPENYWAETGASGNFSKEVVPGHYHSIRAEFGHYENSEVSVDVDDFGPTSVDITLPYEGDGDGLVWGNVTDEDGNAISDAMVWIGNVGTPTDEYGQYGTEMNPDEYDIEVDHDVFGTPDGSTISVEDGEVTTQDLEVVVHSDNELMVSLFVPTLLDSNDLPKPGNYGAHQGNPGPVMAHDNRDGDLFRVPATLDVRAIGDDAPEDIAVTIDGSRGSEGVLDSIHDQSGIIGDPGKTYDPGVTFTVSGDDLTAESYTVGPLYLLFDAGEFDWWDFAVINDIGEIEISVDFIENSSFWEQETGKRNHTSAMECNVPPNSAQEHWGEMATTAAEYTYTTMTIMQSLMMGGLAIRAGVSAGREITKRGALSARKLRKEPLIPSEVLVEPVMPIVSMIKTDKGSDWFDDYEPPTSFAWEFSDGDIDFAGPELYFSD